jgi:5'(3')-deoxyribonucleotidase
MSAQARMVYLDLDGVLADFRGGFVRQVGVPPEALTVDAMWAHVAQVPGFFFRLEPTAGAQELVALAAQIGTPCVLTATPRVTTYPDAATEKRQWVERYFPGLPAIVVAYAREKSQHARPGDILIDDNTDNLRRWARRGGVAIAYDAEAPQSALKHLRRIVLFAEANASARIEGLEAAPEMLALQARVASGDLTYDEAIVEYLGKIASKYWSDQKLAFLENHPSASCLKNADRQALTRQRAG